MNVFEGLVLGLVQGVTEFIPVSSSGHLIIVREILNVNYPSGLMVDAILQLATILAVGIYFRKEIWKILRTFFLVVSKKPAESSDKTLLWAVVLGTLPVALLGLFLESYMETVFRSAQLVAMALILGSLLMLYAEKALKPERDLSVKNGFIIGLFQCLALIPGMSRSGATISGGMLNGLNRVEAARFSFVLSFPIILGSGLKMLFELIGTGGFAAINTPLILAFIVAFLSGIWAIKFLIGFLSKNSLKPFIFYRIIIAVLILIFL